MTTPTTPAPDASAGPFAVPLEQMSYSERQFFLTLARIARRVALAGQTSEVWAAAQSGRSPDPPPEDMEGAGPPPTENRPRHCEQKHRRDRANHDRKAGP
jgi:hypothetical protein